MKINEAQREAIDFHKGSCMVLAGPGSGKTTVITHRARTLIEKYKVEPSSILVITFTKAAAGEMRDRFNRLTCNKNYPVTFGTFHAVYFKILKYAYNYRAENILREESRYEIIREILEDMSLETDEGTEFIKGILSEISMVKSEMLSLEHYFSKNCGEDAFKRIYKRYNDRLIADNVIDFDDMLLMCHELFLARPDILALWKEKYKYILIDEFQDINRVQYEVIRMLAKPDDNLFIVGDDDQSIYSFRGARPDIMLNFPKDYKAAKQIVLDINYRSDKEIVEKAGNLISCNESRFPKKIRAATGCLKITADKPQGSDSNNSVTVTEFKNHIEECLNILHIIDNHVKEGGSLRDIAVLYRTNTIPGVLEEKLMEYNVPFRMKDGAPNIYEHFIARNILSYIRIARGGRDRSDFLQIINRPNRYISRQVFDKAAVDFNDIKKACGSKDYVLDRLFKLEYDLKLLKNMSPYAAISYIRHGIGYDDYLAEYADYRKIKPEELFDVLDELTEAAREYKTCKEWLLHIEEYKRKLRSQAGKGWEQRDFVELSTMHGAKGLEYDTVIIMDANEGIVPHKKSVLKADIEEERRMFYVAVTRAKRRLYIFHCKERYGKELGVSRFVNELLGM